jgi:signal transduction histidine kinase
VRVRITLAAVLVTAVAVGSAGGVLVRSMEDAQVRDLRHDAHRFLDRLAKRIEAGESPQAALVALNRTPVPGTVRVTDRHRRVVASSKPIEEKRPVAGVAPRPAHRPIIAPEETTTRTATTPAGPLTLTATTPVDQVTRSIDALRGRLAVGLPALVALVGVIAWVLVGRALRPVEAIRSKVEGITGATMHRRVPEPRTSDEVGRLAGTMNTMLNRLETSATRQRRFVSDASHELRSPVAVLRAGLEVARSVTDQERWAAIVDSLLTEEARLEALLDDLLLLAAHDENGTTAAASRPVDLTALATREAARPRRIGIDLEASPTVWVAGRTDQLALALSNLVDNAARHATSRVTITVARADSRRGPARLAVDDDGPGIAPPDRERVFERFTRLDGGRTRDDGGSGLGLAVVHTIVTGHHGTVRVDDSPLGGARFIAELPHLDGGGDWYQPEDG